MNMKSSHLFLSLAIVACTAVAWFVLGTAMTKRSSVADREMSGEVAGVWGPRLVQQHPSAWYASPNVAGGRRLLQPSSSAVEVDLQSDPKRRGLVWHQTYRLGFRATYEFTNPTRIPQTVFLSLPLPEADGLHEFRFAVGRDGEQVVPREGSMTKAVVIGPRDTVPVSVSYRTNGTGSWSYRFPDASRISGFRLRMRTNFEEINFPVGTGSPTERAGEGTGWVLVWDYPDVLSAPGIGMDMPKVLNAGPVAARIAFYAPVSLLFFMTVILLIGGLRGIPLHPMHLFFVSAGFFGFHLLFAYLVDLLPLAWSFGIAALVSMVLVCGYLRAVGGRTIFRVAVPAQFAYLVLFSFSFFFDGMTGLVLAVVSVATLALLMMLTAGVDWNRVFMRRRDHRELQAEG